MTLEDITSPDDFAATDPAEVAFTRRRLLHAAGLLTVGAGAIFAGGDAFAARKTTKKKPTRRPTTAASVTTVALAAPAECAVIPAETGGPFPGDGTNGVNVLTQKGVVRRDMRSSFGTSTNVAQGVPLTMRLTLGQTLTGCLPLADAAIYAWHCDALGRYSLYSPEVSNENYCRGVQVANSNGVVEFLTVFPGAYRGRYPHVHFEIYSSIADATNGRKAIATSQLALPEAACKQVYATKGYDGSTANLASTPLKSDNIFNDGWEQQLAAITGDVKSGFVATLNINV